MPILDMPLSQLRTFTGRNECPADIDAFWDKGIAEMEALGTDCELIPWSIQVPGAECFDLWYTGVGGARIHGHYLRPRNIQGKVPAVCLFHGYTGSIGDMFGKLAWVAAGFAVAAMDCRGQGNPSEDKGGVKGNTMHGQIIRGLFEEDPEKLLFRSIFLDAAQLARIVMAMPEVDETRVGATGGSQGGGLTLACAALTPQLNSAAPCIPFLCDYRRVWEMDLDLDAYAELRNYFRYYDPLHEHETEIFTRLGYIDNQHIAHRTKAKVMMFTGLLDNICPPSTQFAAFNKLTSPKEVKIYPDFKHEGLPGSADMILKFMLDM